MDEELLEQESQLRQQLRELDFPIIQILGKRTCMVKENMKNQLSCKNTSDRLTCQLEKVRQKKNILDRLYEIEIIKRNKRMPLEQNKNYIENSMISQQNMLIGKKANQLSSEEKEEIRSMIDEEKSQLNRLNKEIQQCSAHKSLEYYESRIQKLDALKQKLNRKLGNSIQKAENMGLTSVQVEHPIMNSDVSKEASNPISYNDAEMQYRQQVYGEVNGILDASVGDTKGREQFLGILGSFHRMFHKFGSNKKEGNQKEKKI